MRTGRWAERWERRQILHDAEAEAMTRRKPLPPWFTTVLFAPLLVFVGAIAWAQAGPALGIATALLLATDHFVGIILGKAWINDGRSGTDPTALVPRRSYMLASGLSMVVLGAVLMTFSIGRPGLLLGIGLIASGLLGMGLAGFRRIGPDKSP